MLQRDSVTLGVILRSCYRGTVLLWVGFLDHVTEGQYYLGRFLDHVTTPA